MYSDQDILSYIRAINKEKVELIEKLLPHYKIGTEPQHKLLSRIEVHTGYKNTLYRYILNRNTLTLEQLNCILSLYNPETDVTVDILYDEYVIITVPEPQVLIDVINVVFRILHVPEPEIIIAGLSSFLLNYVPQPEVLIDVDSVVIPKIITLVPDPEIILNAGVIPEYIITHVPVVDVIIDKNTVIPIGLPITLVPEPEVIINLLSPIITFVPEPQVIFDHDIPYDTEVFFGVFQTHDNSLRPATADLSALSSFNIDPIPANLDINFPRHIGFYIFAIPEHADIKQTYYISDTNKGFIAGTFDQPSSNLWPAPHVQMYLGKPYRVYISSYVTYLDRLVTLRNSPTF